MIFRFDRFQADDTAFRLTADNAPVALEPKALRLLLYLIENRGRLVRKQELLDNVWTDVSVTESAVTRSVGLLRKALDDHSREPRFIETVPTAGYRFIAHVETAASPAASPAASAPSPAPAPAAFPAPAPAPSPDRHSPEPLPQSPPAIRSHRRFATVGMIILVACILLAGARWVLATRVKPAPLHSLAVLPLDNLSGDPSQDYFADGMTDELITELARIPNLRVASRTSTVALKAAHRSVRDIARQLQVDAIVEGSIVRSGDRIRITAQLIDAGTDRHLWAQSFEGPASDVLSLQAGVAQQIAAQARFVLAPPPPLPPVNPAAHDAYLRGRYFFHKQDLNHSLEAFQQAIALDPGYASAYAAYATVLDAASTFQISPPDELMPKALAAAQRAIQLDPQNGEAYTELGSVQTIYSWDWNAAEQNLTRGISLSPGDSIAEFKYATYLDAVGRTSEAVIHMRRAAQLDPLSFLINRRLGATLYLDRQYDAALAQLQRAAEMENRPGSIDNYMSLIYEQKGEFDQAIQHDLIALRAGQPEIDTAALLGIYRQHGWKAYWRARTHALSTSVQPCTAYSIGVGNLRVNDLDQAFQFFEQALERHCYNMAVIRVDPLFDSVRNDPRYSSLLTRMHQ